MLIRSRLIIGLAGAALIGAGVTHAQTQPPAAPVGNAMTNPYRMLESWPHLGAIKEGAAIGIVPDSKGGVWLQHRGDPAIIHFDASGNILKQFAVTFASLHGLCQDADGKLWEVGSGACTGSTG